MGESFTFHKDNNIKKIKKGFSLLDRIEIAISGLFLAVGCLLMFWAIVLRVTIGYSTSIIEEMIRYLIVWSVFIGSSWTLKNDKHITIDILLRHLPNRWRLIIQTIAFILGALFCLFIVYKGFDLVQRSYLINERSVSAWDLPMFIPKLAVPIGGVLIGLRFIEKIYNNITTLMKR